MTVIRCLITGANGFVGRWLAQELRNADFSVRSLDVRPSGNADEVVGDLLDKEVLDRACEGIDCAVHLASIQSTRGVDWNTFEKLNIGGTREIVKACLRHGVSHLVFFSTELVYGRVKARIVREVDDPRPVGFYGRSKLLAEDACREGGSRGLRLTILRPCNIFGPGKLRVVDELFNRVRFGRIVPLVGNPSKPWQLVDVRDVAVFTRLIIDQSVEGLFNIGPANPPSQSQLYRALIDHAESRSRLIPIPASLLRLGCQLLEPFSKSPLTPDQYYRLTEPWILDGSLLQNRVGYSPRVSAMRSVLETYDAFLHLSRRTSSN